MTVNELIVELKSHAEQGRGNLPVIDEGDNDITSVEFNTDMFPAIILMS